MTRWMPVLPISSIDDRWIQMSKNKIATKLEADFYKEHKDIIDDTLADTKLSNKDMHRIIMQYAQIQEKRELCDRKGDLIKQGDIVLNTLMNRLCACLITEFTEGGIVMYLPLSYLEWSYYGNTDRTPCCNIQSFDENRFLIINYDELTSFEKDMYELVCDRFPWAKTLHDDRARERALCI